MSRTTPAWLRVLMSLVIAGNALNAARMIWPTNVLLSIFVACLGVFVVMDIWDDDA